MGEGIPDRRHPRLACDFRGELWPDAPGDASPAPVTIRSVSLGGMGVAFDEWEGCELDVGDRVLVQIVIAGSIIDLPARVAWYRPDLGSPCDLGLTLELERAGVRGCALAAYLRASAAP